MQQFMKEQVVQQAKICQIMATTVEVLKEAAASLERTSNPAPCPTCTTNFVEALLQGCSNNGKK
jgi:hypothetical protein